MPTHRGPARAVRFLPIALVAAACVGARDAGDRTHAAPRPAVFDHVLVVSVDGLRSDALLTLPKGSLPGFEQLERGAFTLNARCDPEFSVTLPNHTAMLTGRPVHGPAGHDWVLNDEAPKGVTLHSNHGAYVPSIFDVAHDRGVRTALFAGKPKFSLYDVSYDAEHGAPDTTGADEGRDKLDRFVFTLKTQEITDGALDALAHLGERTLVFAHYATTDLTAHAAGWDVTPGSRYVKAVQEVDAELARILAACDADPALRGKTAIVLTADHGGGAPLRSHDRADMWVDYVIPFVVWTGDREGEHDLYALSAGGRADPGLTRPPMGSRPPPIRNGEAGNVALALLGLPPVPGSVIGAEQDLRVR